MVVCEEKIDLVVVVVELLGGCELFGGKVVDVNCVMMIGFVCGCVWIDGEGGVLLML